MCPKKRRWADREMTHVRLGYRVFQLFYELNTTAAKTKSMEDFIRSQYYEGFVKFGRSCVRNEYLAPERFAEWLICDWQEYFKVVSTPRAVHDIRSAKISPWLLYLSDTGDQLLTRFSSEQVKMIDDIINAKFWMKVFANNAEEVDAVRTACEAAGI